MKTNFDFLKDVNKELFNTIVDAQKLFCDEYFTQSTIQVRIFAEKMAKQILGAQSEGLTFDDTLNCLKDKIKEVREKEFIDDLFFIKREGNKCAHGENIKSTVALEVFERAFEASINYAYSKTKDEKINKLQFDRTLLITGKPQKQMRLVDKYIERAKSAIDEVEQTKEITPKKEQSNKEQSNHEQPKKEKGGRKVKPQNPTKEKVKQKVKEAKTKLRNEINKKPKKPTKKELKAQQEKKKSFIRLIIFLIFVTISLIFITKMLVFY